MMVAPDTELVMHQNTRLLIDIIFVVIDNERKIPQHNLTKFSPTPIVLPISCGSPLALRDFCKFLLDPTSLLWVISFVGIMILGHNRWHMKGKLIHL